MQILAAVFTPATVVSAQPVVDLPTKSGITTTAATLGATVITNSGTTIDDYGVVFSATSVNANPTVGGSGVTKVVKGTVQTYGAFTTNVTGLTPGTQYSFAGYAHNASGYGYSSVATFYALNNEPTVQASGVSISSAQRSAYAINWTRGNGANCIVVVKAGSAVDSAPVDGTTYTANTAFGLGTQIGAGNHVAYVGSGNSVSLSGLTAGTTYHVAVYEVNGTGGPENYLTASPATGSATAVPNTYYSFGNNAPTSVVVWWTGTGGTGNNPANFTGGDIFIIQNGHIYASGGANWTLSGGAKLIINSGGTLDMTTDKLFLGGSFVNNGTFLATGATAPTVNFVNFGNVNLSTDFNGTLTVGTNYNVSVVAVGGGGGGAGANSGSTQGGGGGGGACAYSAAVLLQGGNAYQLTVGANGIRGTGGTPNPGTPGGASSFGGGFVTSIIANGGAGGLAGGTGGAGGAAGSTGATANYAGGSAVSGGGGGAGDGGAGSAATGGTGGTGGTGSLLAGGAGGNTAPGSSGSAGITPGGGGAGANSVGAQVGGSAGGAGQITVTFLGTAAAPAALSYNYRSRATGSWSDFNTWSVDKGFGFVDAMSGETPNGGHNSVVVSNTHTVTVSSPSVAVNLTVNTAAVLTVSGGGLAVNRLPGQIVANNLTVNGTLNLATANALSLGNNTTNMVAASGVLNQTALDVVTYGTGVLLTINGGYVQTVTGSGVIPVATWGAGSTCRIDSTFTGNVTSSTQLRYGQAFGNFIWNARGGTTNIIRSMAANSIANWTLAGTLTIENTSGVAAHLETSSGGTANAIAVSVVGITMTGGSFRSGGADSTWTVSGPISVSGSGSDFDGSGSTITALGDVSITGTGQITGGVDFRFAKAGAQNWTVTTSSNLTAPSWIVNSGTALTLGSASRCVVDDLTVNGTLAVSGNSTLLFSGGATPETNNLGTITVASGSTLGGDGSIGANVILSSGAMATNDVSGSPLTLTNGLTLNGNTIYVSTGTNVLAVGNYLLFTNTSGGISGSFANVVISGAGLAANTTSNLVTTASAVTLQVIPTLPVITSTVLSGGNLIISGTSINGTLGGTYYVRGTNDLTAPIANWPRVFTGAFGAAGAFSASIPMVVGVPVNFYRIEQ